MTVGPFNNNDVVFSYNAATDKVVHYDEDGNYIEDIANFLSAGIAFDNDRNLYVAYYDSGSNTQYLYKALADGSTDLVEIYSHTVGGGTNWRINNLRFANNKLIASTFFGDGDPDYVIFDLDGNILDTWAVFSQPPYIPTYIATVVQPGGDFIYAPVGDEADTENSFQKTEVTTGSVTATFTGEATDTFSFGDFTQMAVLPDGNLVVARIVPPGGAVATDPPYLYKMKPDGTYLHTILKGITLNGSLWYGIELEGVAQTHPDGSYLFRVMPTGIESGVHPNPLFVDAEGNIYIWWEVWGTEGDPSTSKIGWWKYDPVSQTILKNNTTSIVGLVSGGASVATNFTPIQSGVIVEVMFVG